VINRMASRPFMVRAGLALVVLAALGWYLGARFRIAIDGQVHLCLPPHRVWLIDRYDRQPHRGATFSFVAGVAMQPFFAPGQSVVKRMVGLPGDRVAVTAKWTTVNGGPVGEGLALAARLAQPPEAFVREQTVPADAVWMMGGTPDSFDSRYWGPLPLAQIRGRAYALF
jgi:conjugal transfer pilin signal peptidase TrbI